MNKKATFIGEVVSEFFSYIALVLVLIIFFFFLGPKSCTDQETLTETDNIVAQIALINYLRTPINENDNIADAISQYCINQNEDQLAKVKIYSTAQEAIESTTITALIRCSNGKKLELRGPLCSNPKKMQIPSFDSYDSLEYCYPIENAEKAVHPTLIQTIRTLDGKTWQKRNLWGIEYYQDISSTKNLLTVDEYNIKYTNYMSSDEYRKKVEEFKQKVMNNKEEIIDINGNTWIKLPGEYIWCMKPKNQPLVSCEITRLSKTKLVETLGDVPVGTVLTD